jgi:hypothetical protein
MYHDDPRILNVGILEKQAEGWPSTKFLPRNLPQTYEDDIEVVPVSIVPYWEMMKMLRPLLCSLLMPHLIAVQSNKMPRKDASGIFLRLHHPTPFKEGIQTHTSGALILMIQRSFLPLTLYSLEYKETLDVRP